MRDEGAIEVLLRTLVCGTRSVDAAEGGGRRLEPLAMRDDGGGREPAVGGERRGGDFERGMGGVMDFFMPCRVSLSALILACVVASFSRNSTGSLLVGVFSGGSMTLTAVLDVRGLEESTLYVIIQRMIVNNETPIQPIGVIKENARPLKATTRKKHSWFRTYSDQLMILKERYRLDVEQQHSRRCGVRRGK